MAEPRYALASECALNDTINSICAYLLDLIEDKKDTAKDRSTAIPRTNGGIFVYTRTSYLQVRQYGTIQYCQADGLAKDILVTSAGVSITRDFPLWLD
jgi:hypothetical protein